jgi:hypothetical protein
MEEFKVKKKQMKEDFLVLTLGFILVLTSLTNVVVFVINEDTKYLKEKIIKIEKEIVELKRVKTQ